MWIELPAIYGKWNSVYRMHLRWAKRGLWTRILRVLAEGGKNGALLSTAVPWSRQNEVDPLILQGIAWLDLERAI